MKPLCRILRVIGKVGAFTWWLIRHYPAYLNAEQRRAAE